MNSRNRKRFIEQEVYSPPSYCQRQARNEEKFYQVSVRVTATVFQKVVLMLSFEPKAEKSDVTISQCFPQKMAKWFKELYCVSSDEVSKFEGKLLDCIDLVFLRKVIKEINEVTVSIMRSANFLYGMRNLVCHEGRLTDDDQLKSDLTDILKHYKKILHNAAKTWKYNDSEIDHLIVQYTDLINKPFLMPVGTQTDPDLESFQCSPLGKKITDARQQCKPPLLYFDDPNDSDNFPPDAQTFSLPIHSHMFLRLMVTSQQSIDSMRTIFNFFSNDEGDKGSTAIATCSDQNKRTSFLRDIQREWKANSKQISFLHSTDLTIFIDGEGLESQHLYQYRDENLLFEDEEENDLLRQMKIVFLLTEMNASSPMLKELLMGFPDAYIILTSSPEETHSFESLCQRCEKTMHVEYL